MQTSTVEEVAEPMEIDCEKNDGGKDLLAFRQLKVVANDFSTLHA